MGFLGSKDWLIVALTYERIDLYRINGNRGKGKAADTIRDNIRRHPRTIFWAVFDRKGKLLESDAGAGRTLIPAKVVEKLKTEAPKNESVRSVVEALQEGNDKAAKKLVWDHYPSAIRERDLTGEWRVIVVDGDDDSEEMETKLKVVKLGSNYRGVLMSPDGSEAQVNDIVGAEDNITFRVTFATPDGDFDLNFAGQVGDEGFMRGKLTPA